MGVFAAFLFTSVLVAETHAFCCFHNQWEGVRGTTAISINSASQYLIQVERIAVKQGTLEGYILVFPTVYCYPIGRSKGTETISYDFTNGRVAVVERYHMNNLITRVKYIRDFNQKLLFQVIDDGLCTVTELPGKLNRLCIPDTAQPSGHFYYGIGNNTYEVESYQLKISVDVSAFLVVTKPDNNNICSPVAEIVNTGLPKANGMMSSGFMNMTEGIKDPDVFIPPPTCYHQQATQSRKDFQHVEMLHKNTRSSVILNF